MSPQSAPLDARHDAPATVRSILAASWASFMFFYIYVDYLHLYKPGAVEDIMGGVVWEFDISQTFVVTALATVSIPALMILLSTMLPVRANRLLNLVVAALYVPYSVFNLVGESWVWFFGLGVVLELAVLAVILRTAWAWPQVGRSAGQPASVTPS